MARPALRRTAPLLLAAALTGLVGLSCASGEPGAAVRDVAAAQRTRLVLVLAVDQLGADRLDPALPGGLGRLAREGRVFEDAALEHARTETCAGHATMLTGRHPGGAGMPGNTVVDRERMEIVYCVEDPSPAGAVLGGSSMPRQGRSPARLQASALGDWLRSERPASRVHAVSGKDRSAITLGGQQPDGAWWIDKSASGGFTTSQHYRSELPDWVSERWSIEALLAPVPASWEHPSGDPPNGARPDADAGEVPRYSLTSPHPVKPEGDTMGSLEAFATSPWLDTRTLDFSRELVEAEQLGARGELDLLAISLSGFDAIGHSYGPRSQESRDALARLDRDLGAFLAFLDETVGQGRVLVALTSDHGVLPLPESIAAGEASCPVAGGRIDPSAFDAGLEAQLVRVFGRAPEGAPGFVLRNGFELHFRPERVAASGASLARVLDAAEAWVEQQPGVARVWRASDIDAGRGPEPMLSLYRNARARGEGPELEIEPAYGCLFSPWPAGTTHGSPHDYDRDVPLVFYGPGVEAGRVPGRAAPVDIAPTLADALGLAAPAELDGRVLPLRGAPVAEAE